MSEHREDALIARAKKGEQAAFGELVERYQQRVYALCLGMCKNPEDAAEAAQDAFFSAWQGLPFFRGESSFSTWLYRLSSNACIDLLRRENRHKAAAGPSLNDEALGLDLPDPAPSPVEASEQRELQALIREGLQSLSPEHRSVLVLRELQQLHYEEIAEALDLDVGTVKSRISRARRQLRKFLLEKGNFFPSPSSKKAEKEKRP